MSYFKIALVSLAVFLAPIALSVSVVSFLSGRSPEAELVFLDQSPPHDDSVPNPADVAPRGEGGDRGTSFAFVKGEGLDPEEDELFLVSFMLRFDTLPLVGKRNNIVAKYERDRQPYPGWAVAVHRLSTSVRPEVYWRGEDGKGGWLTFADVEFLPNRWYAMSVVARPGKMISVYIQALAPHDHAGARSASGWVQVGDVLEPLGDVIFAGGHDISGLQTPRTVSDLQVGAKARGKTAFRGDIAHLLISTPTELSLSIDNLRTALSGGPLTIRRLFAADDVQLWIGDSGRDESRFARLVETAGASS